VTRYKYFGNGYVEATDASFKKFGQELPLSDQTALDIIEAGGGILTTEQFAEIGYTPIEQADKRERRGPAWQARHDQALGKMRELRKILSDRLTKGAEQENRNGE